jgi:ribosome-binding factor A
METKRQKQVARVVQQYMSEIFLREGKQITEDALVTISQVRMTPDLQVARIYLSLYNTDHPDEILAHVEANNKALRNLLGQRVRHQLRKVPELVFFKDDTLDEVFKLEAIFRELKEAKKENPEEEAPQADPDADNDNS